MPHIIVSYVATYGYYDNYYLEELQVNRFIKANLTNRIKKKINLPLISCVVVLTLFIIAVQGISGSSYFDERAALESALEKDIIHCYALEGFYPPSIEYMESNYGLTYNHDRFIIDYKRMGSNVRPAYIIIDRGGN